MCRTGRLGLWFRHSVMGGGGVSAPERAFYMTFEPQPDFNPKVEVGG